MLVGTTSEISKKYVYSSVWIAQDTTISREPRLNVHTIPIFVHIFSHGVLFADFTCHSYQYNILEMLCILFIYFFGRNISCNYVSSYVDKSKVQFDQSSYSTAGKSSYFVYVQRMKAQSHQSRTTIHIYCLCLCVCMYRIDAGF